MSKIDHNDTSLINNQSNITHSFTKVGGPGILKTTSPNTILKLGIFNFSSFFSAILRRSRD